MKITNRYGDDRHIEKLNEEEYLIWGGSQYVRLIGKTRDDLYAVDFEGGPMLTTGHPFLGSEKALIDKIEEIDDKDKPNCYKITIIYDEYKAK